MFTAPRGSSLLALLLRLPFGFDLADVLLFNLLVPVAGAFALAFVTSDVSVFHRVLLCMGVVDDDLLSLLRSPLRGPRPVGLASEALSRPFSLAQRHRLSRYRYYTTVQ